MFNPEHAGLQLRWFFAIVHKNTGVGWFYHVSDN